MSTIPELPTLTKLSTRTNRDGDPVSIDAAEELQRLHAIITPTPPPSGDRAALIEELRRDARVDSIFGNDVRKHRSERAADMLASDVHQVNDFDTWAKNPYTLALQKSITEDYEPKRSQQVAVPQERKL